jgi:hypothetical protein
MQTGERLGRNRAASNLGTARRDLVPRKEARLTAPLGPFELTKLTSQLSVVLAKEEKFPAPESKEIAASYQNKGTLKTLQNIVKNRGYAGLYTGFNLHLSKSATDPLLSYATEC